MFPAIFPRLVSSGALPGGVALGGPAELEFRKAAVEFEPGLV
jgi:hypothetical protein